MLWPSSIGIPRSRRVFRRMDSICGSRSRLFAISAIWFWMVRADAKSFRSSKRVFWRPSVFQSSTNRAARRMGSLRISASSCLALSVRCSRLAMIEMGVVLEIESNAPAAIEPHRHAALADRLDDSERAILDRKPAVVSEKNDAIPFRKVAPTAFDPKGDIRGQCAGLPELSARKLIEGPHLVMGVGEDDAGFVREGRSIAIPVFDQLSSCDIASLGGKDLSVDAISVERPVAPGPADARW